MVNWNITARRVHLYPVAILLGLIAGFCLFVLTSDGLRTLGGGRLGGDFPAFYAAGRIVLSGDGEHLYKPQLQETVQGDLLLEGGRLPFAYPPYVALAYVPFAMGSFKAAYVVYTLMMAGCCLAGLMLVRPHLPRVDRYFLLVVAASLTFYPLFRAVLGGQNTAVSLLCALAAATAAANGRDVHAGLWLGIWLFKPQLALPVAALMALSGRPKVLVGMGVVAALWYVLGTVVLGPLWPVLWWRDGVVPFAAADMVVNGSNGISLAEVAYELGAAQLGTVGRVIVFLLAIWAARRLADDPISLVGVSTAAAVLIAPHAMYYDGGLALVGLIVAGSRMERSVVPLVGAIWVLAAAQLLRGSLPVPPLTIVVAASLWLAVRYSRERVLVCRDTAGAISIPDVELQQQL